MWNKDEVEGKGKQLTGAINVKAAELISDPNLAAEGQADLLEGKIQEAGGRARRKAEEAKAAADEAIEALAQAGQAIADKR